MKVHKTIPLIKGAIKHLPGVRVLFQKKTGGTTASRYCYAVWMRHLKHWSTKKPTRPKVLAELGPGDSLGIGFAALLSGCEKVYAFDVVKYWDVKRNLKIFNELIELFEQRANIPDNKEYPKVRPEIDNYNFPFDIISESDLNTALAKIRLAQIRDEISDIENPNNRFIKCQVPWYNSAILEKDSIDFIYSQAVLEHIEDLENTYKAMNIWLKPGGLMSHTIDFKSHGITKSWNGHWTFSDLEWKIIKGGKSYLINREPFSHHMKLHSKYGFKVLNKSLAQMNNGLTRKQIAKRFKGLSDEDLNTCGLYILSEKL